METALQLLARWLCKPPLNLIVPGRRCRREVNMPMRAAGEPSLDRRRLVGCIVVHHEIDVRSVGHHGVDPLEEVQKLGCPVTLVAFADHRTDGNVERNRPIVAACWK